MAHQSSVIYSAKGGLCNNGSGGGNGQNHAPFQVTGRNVAHANRTASQRAGLAAQLVLGESELVRPTIVQCAAITRVSTVYVDAALQLKASTRALVVKGELSLQDAIKANGLLGAWLEATPDERAALGAAVGVGEVWDAAISPLI